MQCHIKIRADAKEDKNKLPRFFFSSQFYVFCLPSKVQNICSERNMKWKMKLIFETEWIYAKTQQHTTAKTVSFHIFSPFFLVEMRLFIFSIQYFLQMPLHFFFIASTSSRRFFSSLLSFSCCLLFRAHVHKWLLLTFYWFTGWTLAEKRELKIWNLFCCARWLWVCAGCWL